MLKGARDNQCHQCGIFVTSAVNSPISVGGKLAWMDHTNFLVKLKILWVQDLGSSPKSS